MSDAVEVERLAYTFAGRTTPSLVDVSFSLPAGSWTLVVGETGSGKSTLLRALAGLIPHHAAGEMTGRVLLFGRDTRKSSPAKLAGDVGFVSQSPDEQLCATDVEAEIAFGLENLCLGVEDISRRIDEQLRRFDLAELRHARTHQLSGGQKQRLILAAVMAMQPRLLLLDEPLSQLDPQAAHEFLQHLARLHAEGLTIVVAEHRLHDVLPLCGRVLAMREGRLVVDVPTSETRQLDESLGALGFDSTRKLPSPRKQTANAPPPAPALSVRGLGFRFPERGEFALKNVSFNLHPGDCAVLVGGNGSGKSTLLSLLAGLLSSDEGEVAMPAGACGLVMQNPDLMLFNASVRDELAFGPRQQRLLPEQVEGRVAGAATAFSLSDLLDEPPLALSQGQRLRTAAAAVWSMAPAVLLLDEPTTGQDPSQAARLLKAATSSLAAAVDGVQCLLFSTHDAGTAARFADRVLVMRAGELLVDCSPAEFFADDSLLAAAGWRRPAP